MSDRDDNMPTAGEMRYLLNRLNKPYDERKAASERMTDRLIEMLREEGIEADRHTPLIDLCGLREHANTLRARAPQRPPRFTTRPGGSINAWAGLTSSPRFTQAAPIVKAGGSPPTSSAPPIELKTPVLLELTGHAEATREDEDDVVGVSIRVRESDGLLMLFYQLSGPQTLAHKVDAHLHVEFRQNDEVVASVDGTITLNLSRDRNEPFVVRSVRPRGLLRALGLSLADTSVHVSLVPTATHEDDTGGTL